MTPAHEAVATRAAIDADFLIDRDALDHALTLLATAPAAGPVSLPAGLPDAGIGARAALDLLAPAVLGGAARLGDATAMAHMDPPTPWLTWPRRCGTRR